MKIEKMIFATGNEGKMREVRMILGDLGAEILSLKEAGIQAEENQEGLKIMEFDKLREIIAEVLNVDADEITMDTTFVDDLGADSLDVFQIIMGIEEEFDIEISNEDAEKIVSVGDAVEQIKNAIN
mgnify:CR=1 FL=1